MNAEPIGIRIDPDGTTNQIDDIDDLDRVVNLELPSGDTTIVRLHPSPDRELAMFITDQPTGDQPVNPAGTELRGNGWPVQGAIERYAPHLAAPIDIDEHEHRRDLTQPDADRHPDEHDHRRDSTDLGAPRPGQTFDLDW